MSTSTNRIPHPFMVIAGTGIAMFCAAGVAAILGLITVPGAHPADDAPLDNARRLEPGRSSGLHARCADCGTVESTRDVIAFGAGATSEAAAGDAPKLKFGSQTAAPAESRRAQDVTVRLADGSTRVIYEHRAAPWRTGDNVKVVEGVLRPN